MSYLYTNKDESIRYIPYDSFLTRMLIDYLCNSYQFLSYLETFKSILIVNSISFQTYNNIIRKVKYYYNNDISIIPKEECLSGLMRILFSYIPHPYYYDYRPDIIDYNEFNKIICPIKECFRESRFAMYYKSKSFDSSGTVILHSIKSSTIFPSRLSMDLDNILPNQISDTN